MPELIYGIPLPLFDRLALQLPVEKEGVLLDSISVIQSSIRKELSVLLNTRAAKGCEEFLIEDLSVLDFGIPEIGIFGTRSGSDLELLQKIITKAINSFEPRLSNIQVKISCSFQKHHHLDVYINAKVWLHAEQHRVDFQLALNEISNFGLDA